MTDRTELLLLREQEKHGILTRAWRTAHDNLIAFRNKQQEPELPKVEVESNLYYVQPEDAVYVRVIRNGLKVENIVYYCIEPYKDGGHVMFAVTQSGAKIEVNPALPGKDEWYEIFNKLRDK